MKRPRRRGDEPTLDWLERHEHALTVPCPEPPKGCEQPAGEPCLGQPDFLGKRHPLQGPPAHAHRLAAADKANPDDAPPPVQAEPEPPQPRDRHLRPVEQIRRDVASFREACDHCRKAIVWARNERGDRVPIDADPLPADSSWQRVVLLAVESGNAPGDPAFVRATYLKERRQIFAARAHGLLLHIPHRETCPHRAQWSRHKK